MRGEQLRIHDVWCKRQDKHGHDGQIQASLVDGNELGGSGWGLESAVSHIALVVESIPSEGGQLADSGADTRECHAYDGGCERVRGRDEDYADEDGEAAADCDVPPAEEVGDVADEGCDAGDGEGVADWEPRDLGVRRDVTFNEGERATGEIQGDLRAC